MLRLRVHHVDKGVVIRDGGIDVGKEDHHAQQRQDDDIDLFAEEHPEHAAPVGVTGGGDLLRLQVVVVHHGEQLLLAQAQMLISIFHTGHLAFEV